MAQQANRVQEGVAQIRSAVRRVDRQLRKLQKQVAGRRKQLGKEFTSRRKAIERRAQRELTRLRKQPIVKRAESLRAGATQALEQGVASVFEALPIATKSEIDRIDRRVSALSRKLRDLEKNHGVSASEAA